MADDSIREAQAKLKALRASLAEWKEIEARAAQRCESARQNEEQLKGKLAWHLEECDRLKRLQKKDVEGGFPSGIIRLNWNDAEKISMAPAQG